MTIRKISKRTLPPAIGQTLHEASAQRLQPVRSPPQAAPTRRVSGEPAPAAQAARIVLHVGCGPYTPRKLHTAFRAKGWREVRLDIDVRAKPDIVASVTNMAPMVKDSSVDAIWCSHNLEHLHAHEVLPAMQEFVRVLKPTGFALVTCPDIEEVAKLIVEGRLEDPAYVSPAGPITPLDMMYGYGRSIEGGNLYMRHHTAFTEKRLGRLLVEAGFEEALVRKGKNFDLWAIGAMPQADKALMAELIETVA